MLICNQLFMIANRPSLVHGIQCNEPNEQFMRGSVLLKKGEIQIHTRHVYQAFLHEIPFLNDSSAVGIANNKNNENYSKNDNSNNDVENENELLVDV